MIRDEITCCGFPPAPEMAAGFSHLEPSHEIRQARHQEGRQGEVKKSEMTVEWAKERLDHEINTACERYERRLRVIAAEAAKPPKPPRRDPFTERLERALRLRLDGKSYREIGEAIGRADGRGPISTTRSRGIVEKAARMLKHPSRSGHPLADAVREWLDARQGEVT